MFTQLINEKTEIVEAAKDRELVFKIKQHLFANWLTSELLDILLDTSSFYTHLVKDKREENVIVILALLAAIFVFFLDIEFFLFKFLI